jgi:hypothetical protein
MKKIKLFRKNRVVRYANLLVYAVAGILVCLCILVTAVPNHASSHNEPVKAYIDSIPSDSTLGWREGNKTTKMPNNQMIGKDIVGNKALYVKADNKSRAYLGFKNAAGGSFDLFVQAGKHNRPEPPQNYYLFPCTTSEPGSFTIGWREGSTNQPCKTGVPKNQLPTSRLPKQSRETLIAQTILPVNVRDEVSLSPTRDKDTLIQTYNVDDNLVVDVLIGDVTVSSVQNPERLVLREGQRYTHSVNGQAGKVVRIDRFRIAKSPLVQDFLNLANWSTPNAAQIQAFRTALQQPPNPPERGGEAPVPQ